MFRVSKHSTNANFKWLSRFSENSWLLICTYSPSAFFADKVDSLQDRQKTFFANCNKKLKPEERDAEFEKIREEYKKVIEDASEKIQASEECYRYIYFYCNVQYTCNILSYI